MAHMGESSGIPKDASVEVYDLTGTLPEGEECILIRRFSVCEYAMRKLVRTWASRIVPVVWSIQRSL